MTVTRMANAAPPALAAATSTDHGVASCEPGVIVRQRTSGPSSFLQTALASSERPVASRTNNATSPLGRGAAAWTVATGGRATLAVEAHAAGRHNTRMMLPMTCLAANGIPPQYHWDAAEACAV